METTQVLLVDAFADEPLGGVPIAVTPERCTAEQLRAIAGELGTRGAVTFRDGTVEYVGRTDATAVVEGAVAGCIGLAERDRLEPGTHTVRAVDADDHERAYALELREDRSVHVDLPEQSVEATDVATDRLAPALGIDAAAMQDVGADLPVGRVDAAGGTLLVPVNFLEHLSGAGPDAGTLADLLGGVEVARVVAFTFDTLGRETDVHARIFDPAAGGCELPASGVGVGACGRYLAHHGAFDGDRSSVRVEGGHFLDRPGTATTTLGPAPRVGGHGLTVLDGSLTVPDDGDDEIIEA